MTSSILSGQCAEYSRDEFYYFAEVTFLVENTLFRVPRNYFEQESEVFRDMFQLPISEDTAPDGRSDEQPLRLGGVLEQDFRQLLRIMFPKQILTEEKLSVTEWTSVLKLSALWQMDNLRKIATENMSRLSGETNEWLDVLDIAVRQQLSEARELAVTNLSHRITGVAKILLARKYKMEGWLIEGCLELVKRAEYFSDEDEDQLGWKTVIKLYRLRETYPEQRRGYSHNSANIMIRSTIETEFGAELQEMRG